MHEVDNNEGNYKEVKAIMVLRIGRQIQQPFLPIPLKEVNESPKEKEQGKANEDEASKIQNKGIRKDNH